MYLSENDLSHTLAVKFPYAIVEDLCLVSEFFQGSKIVWVDLLPWRIWCGALKPKTVDFPGVRLIGLSVHKIIQRNGWSVIGQPDIGLGSFIYQLSSKAEKCTGKYIERLL